MIYKLAHYLLGMLAGLISLTNPVGAYLLCQMFAHYEVNEQEMLLKEEGRLDAAYQELREFIIGFVIGLAVQTGCIMGAIYYWGIR